ncbi:Regulatory protein MsrR [Enhygromyxa salina]|uniref:Regulatory protein MsrR n=2 Tax=Enhygromyxa salina TaxID=215803 RepID=A0A2S9XAI1_9BACT|nr:Regulatory protein MsrR [Enhygromyxa salina]
MAREPGELRHDAARSFRGVVGAPTPPVELLYEDELGPSLGLGARLVVIPAAEVEPPPPPPPPPRRPAGLEGVSFVLLLGSDNRTQKVVGRTDSMIVAAFRDRDGKVAAFSIPRDLWVALPDVGALHEEGRDHARISSVVRVGEARLGKGEGMPLLRRTLLEQLGIRIDRYASVDFQGFEALIDELGGIDVEVECPIIDCFWINGTEAPCEMMTVEAGRNHMDGATALSFVRSRHGTGDRDRTKRQQVVLLGFAETVRAGGLRGLPGLWRRASPFVTTDLSRDDAAYYASFAIENQVAAIGGFSIKHPMTARHVTPDGKHVLILDREQFEAALAKMFERELPALRERKRCPAPDAALTFRDR